jgi:membrane-bound lytic murein transglycosylase D
MSGISLINFYLSINAVLCAGAAVLATVRAADARTALRLPPRRLLQLGYLLLLAAAVLPLLLDGGGPALSSAPVQVWTSAITADEVAGAPALVHLAAGSGGPMTLPVPWTAALAWLVFAGGAYWLARLMVDAWRMTRLADAAVPIRRHGRVELRVSDRICVPLSFWRPGCSIMLVPAALLERPRSARLAVRHEAQHHRQGDTRAVYLLQALRALFFWNPAAHWLVRQLLDLQEMACDDAILRRHRGVAEDYYHCLFWVASSVGRPASALACGMSSRGRRLLLRRLHTILSPAPRLGAGAAAAVGAASLALLAAFSSAIADPVADRRIAMQDARELLHRAGAGEMAIELNEAVLRELNLLLGTPAGRAWVDASLQRLRAHAPQLRAALQAAVLPRELLAVPFIESGFVNRPQGANPSHGAGLWMFIAPTARHYGLVVDGTRDDRLDIELETDAAMRMLQELRVRFGDWRLALLAYNVGTQRVADALAETGSADPWAIAAQLYEGRINYLARIMAGVLILSHEDTLAWQ